jgi:hypothetical protein
MNIYVTQADVMDLDSNSCGIIVERKDTQEVMNAVLKQISDDKAERQALVLGNPGIGKSRALLVLLRLLLKQHRRVVYESYRKRRAWLCEWSEAEYKVKSVDQQDLRRGSIGSPLNLPDTCHLIDPFAEKQTDVTAPNAKQVLVSSPDENRFKEWEKGPTRRYIMNTCTAEEMLAIRFFIRPCDLRDETILTEDQVRCRYRDFGGIIRHVFCKPEQLRMRSKKAHDILSDLVLIDRILRKGVLDGNLTSEQSAERNQTPSLLFQMRRSMATDSGWDQYTLEPVSAWAAAAVARAVIEHLEASVVLRTSDGAATVGTVLWEKEARKAIARGGTFKRRQFWRGSGFRAKGTTRAGKVNDVAGEWLVKRVGQKLHYKEEATDYHITPREIVEVKGSKEDFAAQMKNFSGECIWTSNLPNLPVIDDARGKDNGGQYTAHPSHSFDATFGQMLIEHRQQQGAPMLEIDYIIPQCTDDRSGVFAIEGKTSEDVLKVLRYCNLYVLTLDPQKIDKNFHSICGTASGSGSPPASGKTEKRKQRGVGVTAGVGAGAGVDAGEEEEEPPRKKGKKRQKWITAGAGAGAGASVARPLQTPRRGFGPATRFVRCSLY